jgi:hypothetical protein
MIYNKPRDLSWRLLDSQGKKKSPAELPRVEAKPDNLIIKPQTVKKVTTPATNVDIILDGKPQFAKNMEIDENTIIDISTMPDIVGVPILQFPTLLPEEIHETKRELAPPPYKKPIEDKKAKVKKSSKENTFSVKGAVISRIAVFFIVFYLITVIAFIIPLRPTYSEAEKRELTQFPKFTINALMSGDYFEGISTWFSDTFPFREQVTSFSSLMKEYYGFNNVAIHGELDSGDEIPDLPDPNTTEPETEALTEAPTTPPPTQPVTMPDDDQLNSGGNPNAPKPDIQTQNLGAIIVAGESGYEYYSFSKSLAPRFIDSVSAIGEKSNISGNVYAMVVPTSIDVTLDDALRSQVSSANQEKALTYINGSIKNAITVNSIYPTMRAHRSEYIYFRTDHHWTALGAYYAYAEWCNSKGIAPIPLSQYNTATYYGFTGTFYTSAGRSSTLKENSDMVTTYTPFNNHTCTITKTDGTQYKWDVVKDVSDYGSTLKYLTFIGGDNPLTTIVNEDNPNGETCVVVKDSYGNAFVPFLIPHYSKIYVIDPRYYESTIEEFCNNNSVTDIIFISNISTTRNEIFIKSMEGLTQ